MPRHKYLVQWKGFPDNEASWEPVEALWQFQKEIDQFHDKSAMKTSPDSMEGNVTVRTNPVSSRRF